MHWLCFRQGTLSFDDACNTTLDAVTVKASSNTECKQHLLSWQGRLGIKQPVRLAENSIAELKSCFITHDSDCRPVLILGTGECNAPAYLLACALEAANVKVKVQSTTRSPIHVGNDISLVCQFEDNYNDGIANYIYNLNPLDYKEIIVCHETPLNDAVLVLCHAWQAISARFFAPEHDNSRAVLNFLRP